MPAPWMVVRDLVVRRGGRVVLDGVSFALTGRAAGLVGENGVGKTTLISSLLAILPTVSGSAQVLGLDVPGDAMKLRARVGVMAEQGGIFGAPSVIDAVAYAGELCGLGRNQSLRQAHRCLDSLGAGQERHRPPDELSAGQRQRCKLAMALVSEPDLLVLDEPTVGLDPPGREELLTLVEGLVARGVRVLLSTHIMGDAERICDQMVLLSGGKVAWSGAVEQLTAGKRGAWIAEGDGLDERVAEAIVAAGAAPKLTR